MSEKIVFNDVEAAGWDLDGTLIESLPVMVKCVEEVVSRTGHQMPSLEMFKENYHASLYDSLKVMLNLTTHEEIQAIEDLFQEVQPQHYEGETDEHFYDDAVKLVYHMAAQGIHQAIITNRNNDHGGTGTPRTIIGASKIAEFFPVIHCGDEVEQRKPHPLAFNNWHIDLGVDPENILVIGDQAVDAHLALSIGARALILCRDGKHYQEIPKDKKVTVVPDLHSVVINN